MFDDTDIVINEEDIFKGIADKKKRTLDLSMDAAKYYDIKNNG